LTDVNQKAVDGHFALGGKVGPLSIHWAR